MSASFQSGSLLINPLELAASGSSYVLTASSEQSYIFSGSTSQTVVLPVSSTLNNGTSYTIANRTTTVLTITKSGGTTLASVESGGQATVRLVDKTTDTWDSSSASGDIDQEDTDYLITGFADSYSQGPTYYSALIDYDPTMAGGEYWVTNKDHLVTLYRHNSEVVNGFAYDFAGVSSASPFVLSTNTYRRDLESHIYLTRAAHITNLWSGAGFKTSSGRIIKALGDDASSVAHSEVQEYNVDTNVWTSKTAFPVARYEGYGVNINGYGFVGAGSAGTTTSALNEKRKYIDTSDTWVTMRGPTSAKCMASTAVVNGVCYQSAGSSAGSGAGSITQDHYRYYDSSDSWTTSASYPQQIYAGTGGDSLDDFFVFGGINAGSYISTVNKYCLTLNIWLGSQSYPSTTAMTSSVNLDNDAYVYGGILSGTTVRAASYTLKRGVQKSLFNIVKSGISSASISASSKYFSPGVKITSDGGNTFYSNDSIARNKFSYAAAQRVLGGNTPTAQTTHYVFDDLSNTWTTRTAITVANSSQYGFNLNGKPYAVGGGNNASANFYYDTDLDTYVSKTAVPIPRYIGGSSELDGYGLLYGGIDSGTGLAITVVHLYNGDTDTWSVFPSAYPASILGNTGSRIKEAVFSFGGSTSNSNGAVATSYRLDRTVGTFSSIASIGNGVRYEPSSVGMDSAAYLLGGAKPAGANQNTVEKYVWTTNTWTLTGSVMSNLKSQIACNPINGYIIASGGYSSGNGIYYNSNDRINMDTGTSSTLTAVPATVGLAAKNFSSSGRQVIRAKVSLDFRSVGSGLNTGVWFNKQSFSISSLSESNPFNLEGYAYTAGGSITGSLTILAQKYDHEIDYMLRSVDLGTATRQTYGASFAGFGYRISGVVLPDPTLVATGERLNPMTMTWSSITAIPTIGYSAVMAVIGHQLHVIGGKTTASAYTNVNRAYGNSTNAWLSYTAYALGTIGSTSGVVQDGVLYVDAGIVANVVSAASSKYYVDTGTWVTITSRPVTAFNQSSIAMPFGILSSGGGSGTNLSYIYSTVGNYWYQDGNMSSPVGEHSASPVGANVVSIGGTNGGTKQNVVQSYEQLLTKTVLGVGMKLE
jgi:hypothetical protein